MYTPEWYSEHSNRQLKYVLYYKNNRNLFDLHHYIYAKCTFRRTLFMGSNNKNTIAAIIHHGPGLEQTRNAAGINHSKQCRYKQTNKGRPA